MIGFYLLSFVLAAAFVLEPEGTENLLTAAFVKLEVYIINLRLKWASWLAYRTLVKLCKDSGFPAPGPFRYVDIWDRDS